MVKDLRFDIEARDETARAFRSVQGNINRTERHADALGNRAQRAGRAIAAGIGGVATVAAIRELGRATERAVDELDDIAKSADKIGLTTDALQELRGAADLSGVSVRELDTALGRFARVASDANEGLSTAVRGFERVGVEVTDVNGQLKPIDQLLEEVADGFVELESDTLRAATAQELFGRSGTVMVNLIGQGSEAIADMRAELRELGVVIDEDLIRRTVVAKDELTLMRAVIDSELTVALAELAPLLVDISGFFADVAWATGLAYRGMQRFLGLRLDAIEVPRLTSELAEARGELERLDAAMDTFAEGGGTRDTGGIIPGGAAGALNEALNNDVPAPSDDPEELNRQLDDFASRREEIVDRIERIQAELAAALGPGESLVPPDPELPPRPGGGGGGGASSADAQAAAFERLTEQIRDKIAAQELEIRTMGLSREEAQALTDQYELERLELELLAAAKEAGNAVTQEEVAEAQALIDTLRQVTAARRERAAADRDGAEASEEASAAERALADSISTVGDELVRVIEQGGTFLDVLIAIADQILRMPALQDFISGGGAADFLTSGLGNLLGLGGGGGGGFPTSLAGAGSLTYGAGDALATFPSFHQGADFLVGGRTGVDRNLVQFMATKGERVQVTPAHEGAAAPTFGQVTFNFPNVRDREGAREAAGSAKRRLAELAGQGRSYL